jgi:tetratricopeptide (TPR) repeat protein
MRRCLASAIAIAVLVPALAGAQPRPTRPVSATAKRELERGLALFEARDYAAAIGAFDAGYAIDPHPDFLYAKAQAQRIGGDCRGALATYDAFLARKPPEKEAARAKANMARCTELLAVSAPPIAVLAPEPPAPAPASPPPAPAPAPAPASMRDDRAHPARAWWRDRPGLVLAGTGVAALATGATFAWLARSSATAATDAPDLLGWYEREAVHRRDRTIAGISAGAGAALIAAAAVRFAWARHTTGDRTVAATVAPGGAVVWLGGSW